MGLLGQVLRSITERRILKVKETYSRLTIGDLTAKVGLEGDDGIREVTRVLNEMVSSHR